MKIEGVSRTRYALILAATMLMMMVVVGTAQYLVSRDGTIRPGVLVAIAVPTGLILGKSLAKSRGRL